MSTFVEDAARVIRGMLAEHNITQTRLAEALDRAQSYVSERETGRRGWTTGDLDVIAGLLDMSPAELLREMASRAQAAEARRGVALDPGGLATRPAATQPAPAPRTPPARSRRG